MTTSWCYALLLLFVAYNHVNIYWLREYSWLHFETRSTLQHSLHRVSFIRLHNDLRLTGRHETGHISQFTYGVANRGASIRIPRHVAAQGYGYIEDRRPASNIGMYSCLRFSCDFGC